MADFRSADSFVGPQDRQLLTQSMTTSDPEASTQKIRLPTLDGPPSILLQYDVTPAKVVSRKRPYVWCAHCGKNTHWRGYIVELAEGPQVNIGKDCGSQQFGLSFNAIENSFNAQLERQNLVPHISRLHHALPTLLDSVKSLMSHPGTRDADELADGLQSRAPRLWRYLQSEASSSIVQLKIYRTVLDSEAVARTKENIRAHFARETEAASTRTARTKARLALREALASVGERYREEVAEYGLLRGTGFAGRRERLGQTLGSLSRALHELSDQINVTNSDALSDKVIKSALQQSRELLSQADRASDAFAYAAAFRRSANLTNLAAWANASDLGLVDRFDVSDNTLWLGAYALGRVADSLPDETFSAFRSLMHLPARSFDAMPMARRFNVAA